MHSLLISPSRGSSSSSSRFLRLNRIDTMDFYYHSSFLFQLHQHYTCTRCCLPLHPSFENALNRTLKIPTAFTSEEHFGLSTSSLTHSTHSGIGGRCSELRTNLRQTPFNSNYKFITQNCPITRVEAKKAAPNDYQFNSTQSSID